MLCFALRHKFIIKIFIFKKIITFKYHSFENQIIIKLLCKDQIIKINIVLLIVL